MRLHRWRTDNSKCQSSDTRAVLDKKSKVLVLGLHKNASLIRFSVCIVPGYTESVIYEDYAVNINHWDF